MTNVKILRAVAGLLLLFVAAASPGDAPNSQGLTLVSPNLELNGQFGGSVAGAGDVNQDGLGDLIVGASGEGPGNSPDDAGRAYVFSGQDQSLLFELASPNEEADGGFGASIAGAGDVNRDGFADLIVGAFDENVGPVSAGRAYVFSGEDGGVLLELVSPHGEASGQFGFPVAGVGDLNQDGSSDVVVGARLEDPGNSPFQAGRAYVYSGQDGGLLYELVSPNEVSGGHFGSAVAGAGDVNQDGIPDVVVGAEREGGSDPPGRAYVFSGADGGVLFELVPPDAVPLGNFGFSAAGVGDVNQDGFADVIVGADSAYRAYVFSGQDGSVLFTLASSNGGAFGTSVAAAGDVNQDGSPEVLVGAPFENQFTGRVYVFSGRNGVLLFELDSPNEGPDSGFGYSVAGVGDINQDGAADVMVGAPFEDPEDVFQAGRAYVFLSPFVFRINSGGPNYTAIDGSMFVADRPYGPGSFGYVGGVARHFDQPIGGTDDDPLYQDVRVARRGDSDGIFSYRFDVPAGQYDVTLYLMAPALDGPGNVVMDVKAEEDVAFDDLDVTAEAGGEYQALVKTFAVDVSDGTLDLRFRAVNKAAVVSAIAVAAQPEVRGMRAVRRLPGGE